MQLHSHDDFTPLREIIVGSAANYLTHDRDVTFELFHYDNLTGYGNELAYPRLITRGSGTAESWKIKQRYTEELHEDVESLAATIASLGVTVHRPLPLPSDPAPIAGLGWQAAPTPALNIRDNTLILGDEIIETPPAVRARYLETRLLAPVFQEYFQAGARWTTMPRPLLTDMSFDLSYARDATTVRGLEVIGEPQASPYDVGLELMMDAAQVLRLGRDLLINVAHRNHRLAVGWLERHLQGRYRIHIVNRLTDGHIDSMLLAIRPGLFLARNEALRDMLPESLRSWKFLIPPPPDPGEFPVYDQDDLVLTSPYIDLNVLSIDEDTVLVNEDCTGVRKLLEAEGITAIPVRHRHRRLFGGGFHCFTLDTHRDGGCEDYL